MNLVFFLEEYSARVMLEGLLPKLCNTEIEPYYVVFEGKSDLEKQIVQRMRGWLKPDTKFIILRDQDSGGCVQIKNRLLKKCQGAGKSDVIVRIACRELESWYLGDLAAVETGLDLKNLARHQNKMKYRAPDTQSSPSTELQKLTKNKYQKVAGSRAIGPHLSLTNNRSHSFRVFVSALQQL